jgi:hypothetical protein
MAVRGIDYSLARPGGAAIRAAGFEFVMRYIDYPGAGGKGLTGGELADLRANGLAVGLVFERYEGRPNEGRLAGVADAQVADRAARSLGFPPSQPIYFAIDFDAQPGDYAAIDEYFAGAASVLGLGRVGAYGHDRVLGHLRSRGLAMWFWQCLAWSGGRTFEGRHLYQAQNGQFVNGGAVDVNFAYGEDQGLWKVEDDMADPRVDALLLRVAELERRTGGDAGADFDLLAGLQSTQKALRAHIDAHPGGALVPHTHRLGEAVPAEGER